MALGLPGCMVLPAQAPQNDSDAGSHRTFAVRDEATHCTVKGVAYVTGFDCATAHAQAWTEQTHLPTTIELDSGVYETRTGLQMDPRSGATISLKGRGKGEFQGGTTIKLVAPLATGVISYPFLSPAQQSGYWSNLHLESFTIDANGNAPMCMDLYALRVAHLSDLSCEGANGARAWVRIGGYGIDIGGTVPKQMQGLSFQVIAQDIFVYNNGTGPGAVVRPQVVRGAIAAYTIADPGSYREIARAPVLLKGATAGDTPCDVMPTGLEARLVEDPAHPGMRRLAQITARSPGLGCKSGLHIAVPDMPPAQYGFEIASTDSTFYDLTDDSVGTVAAITDRGSDASVFYHPHGWNVVDMMDAWGHDSIVDPEIDSVYGYGIRVRYGESTTITRPAFVYLPHAAYAAVGDFYFDQGTRNTRIVNPACIGREPNEGYVQMAGPRGAFLPGYGTSRQAAGHAWQGTMPEGLEVVSNQTCGAPSPLENGVSVQQGFGEGSAVRGRELQWSATNRGKSTATPFLLAVLPSAAAAQGNPSIRVTFQGGPIGVVPAEATVTLSGGPRFSYTWRVAGQSDNLRLARLEAYSQKDGSLKLYAALSADASIAVRIDLVQDAEVLLVPEPAQSVPSGTLVFDSGQPAKYPAQPIR